MNIYYNTSVNDKEDFDKQQQQQEFRNNINNNVSKQQIERQQSQNKNLNLPQQFIHQPQQNECLQEKLEKLLNPNYIITQHKLSNSQNSQRPKKKSVNKIQIAEITQTSQESDPEVVHKNQEQQQVTQISSFYKSNQKALQQCKLLQDNTAKKHLQQIDFQKPPELNSSKQKKKQIKSKGSQQIISFQHHSTQQSTVPSFRSTAYNNKKQQQGFSQQDQSISFKINGALQQSLASICSSNNNGGGVGSGMHGASNSISGLNDVKFKKICINSEINSARQPYQLSATSAKAEEGFKNAVTNFTTSPPPDDYLFSSRSNNNLSNTKSHKKLQQLPQQLESPLLSAEELQNQQKIQNRTLLNQNLYYKMLDHFSIPYTSNIENIKERLGPDLQNACSAPLEMHLNTLQPLQSGEQMQTNNSVVKNLLQNQLQHPLSLHYVKAKQINNNSVGALQATRKEVEQLSKWLDLMIFQIYQGEQQNIVQILEDTQVVYSSCLKELVRQVSVDCLERGLLIDKVWNAHLFLVKRLIKEIYKDNGKQEKQNLDDITRLLKNHTIQIDHYKEELEQRIADQSSLEEKQKLMKLTAIYLKKQNNKMNKIYRTTKFELDQLIKAHKELEFELICVHRELNEERNYQEREYQFLQQQKSEINIEFFDKKGECDNAQGNPLLQSETSSQRNLSQRQLRRLSTKNQGPVNYNKRNTITGSQRSIQLRFSQDKELQGYQPNYQLQQQDGVITNSQRSIQLKFQQSKPVSQLMPNRQQATGQHEILTQQQLNPADIPSAMIASTNSLDQSDYQSPNIQYKKQQSKQLNVRSSLQLNLKLQSQNTIQMVTEGSQQVISAQKAGNTKSNAFFNSNRKLTTETEDVLHVNNSSDKPPPDDWLEDLDQSLLLLEKQVQTDVVKKPMAEKQTNTDISSTDIIRIKGEMLSTNQSETSTQTEKNLVTQPTKHQSTQTSILGPEYDELMAGIDLTHISKLQDNIEKAEEGFEEMMDTTNLNMKQKQKVYSYIQQLTRGKNTLLDLLKQEICLKEHYLKDSNTIKIAYKEKDIEMEDLRRQKDNAMEALEKIQAETGQITDNLHNAEKQCKKLEKKMINTKHLESQIFQQTEQLQQSLLNTSFFQRVIEKIDDNSTSHNDLSEVDRGSRDGNEETKQQQKIVKSQQHIDIRKKKNLDDQQNVQTELFDVILNTKKNSENQLGIAKDYNKKNISANEGNNNRTSILSSEKKLGNKQATNSQKQEVRVRTNSRPAEGSINKNDLSLNLTNLKFQQNLSTIAKIKSAVNKLNNLKQQQAQENSISDSSQDEETDYDDNLPQKLTSNKDSVIANSQDIRGSQQLGGKKLTKATAPRFHFHQRVQKIQSANTQYAQHILNKIMKKIGKSQSRQTMTKRQLLKFIGQIYGEIFKNRHKTDKFHVLCYDFFIANFGLKKVAEFKISQLYEAVFFYNRKDSNNRIRLFGRFLGLYDTLTQDELDIYMDTIARLEDQIVSGQLPGLVLISSQQDPILIPLDRGLQQLKQIQDQVEPQSYQQAVQYLYEAKTIDKFRQIQAIELDIFMQKYIEVYKDVKQLFTDLDKLFNSADLDNDGTVQFYEFMCLFKYIEGEKDAVKIKIVQREFFKKCDVINPETEERALSSDRFRAFALSNKWFQNSKLESFAYGESPVLQLKKTQAQTQAQSQTTEQKLMTKTQKIQEGSINTFKELKEYWNEIKVLFKLRLFKVGKFDQFFQRAIRKLDKCLSREELDERTLLISYRIIDLETKRVLLNQELKECLPEQLLDIENKALYVLESANYFEEIFLDPDDIINFNMWF